MNKEQRAFYAKLDEEGRALYNQLQAKGIQVYEMPLHSSCAYLAQLRMAILRNCATEEERNNALRALVAEHC